MFEIILINAIKFYKEYEKKLKDVRILRFIMQNYIIDNSYIYFIAIYFFNLIYVIFINF